MKKRNILDEPQDIRFLPKVEKKSDVAERRASRAARIEAIRARGGRKKRVEQ